MATIESRHNKKGCVSYYVKIRLKGYPTQRASFKRKTDAVRWAQSTESAIREGRHFKTREAKKHTLADAIDRYVKDVLPGKAKGGANQKAQLDWWRAHLGAYSLADVTPPLVAECRNELLKEPKRPKSKRVPEDYVPQMRTAATVVRYLAALSHVLSTAMREWDWIESNPLSRVKKPKEPRGRDRFLSDDERRRLLEVSQAEDKKLHLVIVLALSTGMRRGEIMSLRWPQVDIAQRRITLHKTKNGEVRSVPLAGRALQLLTEHSKVRCLNCDLVFPGDADGKPFDLQKPWYRVLKKADICHFRFHDLRHSAASYLAMNGASMLDIAAILGHKTLAMVKRYSHLSDAHTQQVVSKMNAVIFNQLDSGTA